MDPISKATKTVDHNRYAFLGLAIGVALTFFVTGCGLLEGKAIDPVSGEKIVAADIAANVNVELVRMDVQIDTLVAERNALAESGGAAVERANADTARNYAMVDAVTSLVMSNPLVAASGAGVALAGLGGIVGLWRDNKRKDGVIKKKAKTTNGD